MGSSTLLGACTQCKGHTIQIKFVKVVPIERVTFFMTYSSSSPLLALNQNGKIGRLKMSSLKVSKQESGFRVVYFSFFLKLIFRWSSFPFIAIIISSFVEHMHFLVFQEKQLDFKKSLGMPQNFYTNLRFVESPSLPGFE